MTSALINSMLEGMARAASVPKVFPSHITMRAKTALREVLADADGEFPGADLFGDSETTGDGRYAFTITDKNGQRYRVTVEVDNQRAS